MLDSILCYRGLGKHASHRLWTSVNSLLDLLPPRIQTLRMTLMRYSNSILHMPGKSLWREDTLSCSLVTSYRGTRADGKHQHLRRLRHRKSTCKSLVYGKPERATKSRQCLLMGHDPVHGRMEEPLMPPKCPERPWQKLEVDLFCLESKMYLLVIDYFSEYTEIVQLSHTRSTDVIVHLKSIFARHGIAEASESLNSKVLLGGSTSGVVRQNCHHLIPLHTSTHARGSPTQLMSDPTPEQSPWTPHVTPQLSPCWALCPHAHVSNKEAERGL